ncbi:MAG: DUF938 domain-containing protein [Henriciella sp.]|uniref:DUF938 domain-containing protein n=1 Tax=Henriciella sp. TaxID=1968823 RepID=UPI0032EB8876
MSEDQDDIGSSGKSVALEQRNTGEDGRRFSPSAARNRQPIAEVFAEVMPLEGRILEIASGTGEHGAFLAAQCPGLEWLYSDVDRISMDSQRAWAEHAEAASRLSGPVQLDASEDHWGEAEEGAPYDGIFNANMIHIAPFAAAQGLLKGAGRVLRDGGKLFLYGPFARDGEIAESNARFSDDLKRRDPEWGVRDLERDLMPIAGEAGLVLDAIVEMPANNLCVVFRKG